MKYLLIASVVVSLAVLVAPAFGAICSNASLNGVFGFENVGLDAPGQPGTSVGQFSFDGNGSVSGGFTHAGAQIATLKFTGTYSVSKDCTGSMVLTTSNGGTENSSFVIDNNKKGLQIIRTDSGQVKPGFALAQGIGVCGLAGKKQTFAFSLAGTDDKARPDAFVGQVILDGKGNLTGKMTVSIDGGIGPASLTGTYTENADCTGTMQITSSLGSTSNLNTVVVNMGKEILLIATDSGSIISGNAQQ